MAKCYVCSFADGSRFVSHRDHSKTNPKVEAIECTCEEEAKEVLALENEANQAGMEVFENLEQS